MRDVTCKISAYTVQNLQIIVHASYGAPAIADVVADAVRLVNLLIADKPTGSSVADTLFRYAIPVYAVAERIQKVDSLLTTMTERLRLVQLQIETFSKQEEFANPELPFGVHPMKAIEEKRSFIEFSKQALDNVEMIINESNAAVYQRTHPAFRGDKPTTYKIMLDTDTWDISSNIAAKFGLSVGDYCTTCIDFMTTLLRLDPTRRTKDLRVDVIGIVYEYRSALASLAAMLAQLEGIAMKVDVLADIVGKRVPLVLGQATAGKSVFDMLGANTNMDDIGYFNMKDDLTAEMPLDADDIAILGIR